MVRWKKAFKLPKETEIREEDLERWVNFLRQKHLSLPALITLEVVKPVSFLIHTVAVGLHPILSLFIGARPSTQIYEFFQNRQLMERLIQKLEEKKNE